MKRGLFSFCLLFITIAAFGATDWTDRKEYDLVLDVRSESSPQKRLALLDTWSKGYPTTSLAHARQELYLSTYESLSDHAHMFEIAKQLLAAHPEDPVGLYWLTVLAPQQTNQTGEILDAGDKAARALLSSVPKYFTPDKKPAAVSDADWQKQKTSVEVLAQRTMAWANWQRANFSAAADDLSACLKKDPGNAEISSWLGIVSALDNSDKQPQALWHLARATNKDLSTPLSDDQRRQVNGMLENMYASYHGSSEGLDQLRKATTASALPPPEFNVDSATVVDARRKETELALTNPELAAWLAMRRQLEAADGEKYFDSDLKSKPLPSLRGTVIKATPARGPREFLLSMNDPASPDVTLRLNAPLDKYVPAGAKLSFQGVGDSYVKVPFALVITADTAQLIK